MFLPGGLCDLAADEFRRQRRVRRVRHALRAWSGLAKVAQRALALTWRIIWMPQFLALVARWRRMSWLRLLQLVDLVLQRWYWWCWWKWDRRRRHPPGW